MIFIIGAMETEVMSLVSQLQERKTDRVGSLTYECGKLRGAKVVIAQCGIGMVAAAAVTAAGILKYSPRLVINTGVAGCLDGSHSLLALTVPRAVVQHDMDTTAFGDRKGYLSDLKTVEIALDVSTAEILREIAAVDAQPLLASGDKFVATAADRREIADAFGASVCDMEGGAIAHAARILDVPCAVVRVISDTEGEADYLAFVDEAAKRSAAVVTAFCARSAESH